MNLMLKESIICGGAQYLPKTVVDTVELGISDAEAAVLVRRGTAELHEQAVTSQAAESAPESAPSATQADKPARRRRASKSSEE